MANSPTTRSGERPEGRERLRGRENGRAERRQRWDVAPAGGKNRRGSPDTENQKLVNQKARARFERVESYLLRHKALFTTQGAVVATWRTYRGRRLGPYFQVSYREGVRQRSMYLGASKELADRVRELLGRIQWRRQILRRRRRERQPILRLMAEARAALRESKERLRKELARWGIVIKGWEFRGVRRAFKNPPPYYHEWMARRWGIPPDTVGRSGFL